MIYDYIYKYFNIYHMDRKINKRDLIKGFNNFKSINEKIDPYKMDIS